MKLVEARRVQIQTLAKQGYQTGEIGRIVGASDTMVRKWKKIDGHIDQPRSGRPSKLTPAIKTRIEELTRDQVSFGTRKVTRALNAELFNEGQDTIISRRTIISFLHSNGLGSKVTEGQKKAASKSKEYK